MDRRTPKRQLQDNVNSAPEGSRKRPALVHDITKESDVLALIDSSMDDQKVLADELFEYGMSIGKLEDNLKMLENKKSILEDELSRLHATIVHVTDKPIMMGKIISNHNSVAAVVCELLGKSICEKQCKKFADDMFGVVALLGTVQSRDVSRMLAQFLGENQMLSIVCKSASAFKENIQTYHRYEFAASFGYSLICLEDISPYKGQIGKDPQQKLCLPDPILNGIAPSGYLGHAVNMIELDENQLRWNTDNGHGLRATLFNLLFGELQVYTDRHSMIRASLCNCIKNGAVSLDGVIYREPGIISIGYMEPTIQFPVVSAMSQLHSSPLLKAKNLKLIEEMSTKLIETNTRLDEERKEHEETMRKLIETRDKYNKLCKEKGP